MKTIGKFRLLGLIPLAILPLLLFQLTPSQGETAEDEKITPLTGYRFVSDRAFDPLPTEPKEGATVTVNGIAPPVPAEETPAPYGADELFPVDLPPAKPKSAASLSPETTPGTQPIVETNSPSPESVPAAKNDTAPPKAAATTAATTAATEPQASRPQTVTADAQRTPPNTDESLVFPLTLEIPGYDPNAIPTETAPAASASSQSGSMDYRNQVDSVEPMLKISSPSVVGVGATLAGSQSDIYMDALVPFWQSRSDYVHTIAFFVPRIATTEDIMTTASLGLGIRTLHGEGSFMGGDFPWIFGANVFYDFTHAVSNNDYNQVGAGIEWMSPFLDLRVNGYLPESTENKVDETSRTSSSTSSSTTSSTSYGSLYARDHSVYQPFTTTTTTNFQRTTTTQFFEQYERALQGFDGEAGILLPEKYTLFPVRFYGGFYSFDNPYGDDIVGPKARIEARPFSFLLLDASWYQDEELLGSTWYLGARASMTIGGGPVPPVTSKPLHDTTEGPKTEAYNPYASFQSRLVERIPRNYQAVLTTSPFLENIGRRQISVSRYSTSSETSGQITVASRLIFVNAARGSATGNGTWQNPQITIQGGADLAIANLGSSGQIWTVWTQGGVGPYNEDITVTDSVRFTSSSIPITGRGGQTFGGTGDGPIVQGGFLFGSLPGTPTSPSIPVGSVQGYEITGGHSAASFAGITFVNVEVANASRNRIDTIGGTGIEVVNTGTTATSGTFASNGIFNTGGDAIHFDLADDSESRYTVADSGFENLTGNGVRIDATDSATYDITVARSGASGLANAGIFLNAEDDSSGSLTVSNSTFDGGGVDVETTENAEATLAVSGTLFENDPNNVFTLTATDSSSLTSSIRNNVLEDNQSALDLEVTGTAVTDTTFSGNSVTNSTNNAVVGRFEGTGTQDFTVTGNEISSIDGDAITARSISGTVNTTVSNNTIDTATNRAIVLRASQGSTMKATVSGNGTSNTSNGGILIRASGSSSMDATASNNVVAKSGDYGIQVQGANASNASVILSGNTIRETVSAAINILGSNNALVAVLAQANAITDSTTTGIQADASNRSLVSLTASNNNITNTTQEGILFTGRDNSSSRFEARSNLIASTGNASGIRTSFFGNHDTEVIIATNLIGPSAQQGVQIDTSDNTTADFTLQGNRINDSSQDAIRMTLYSTEDQTVALYENNLQRNGARGINLITQGPKEVSIYNNTIGTTGGAAVRARMESGGLTLRGASLGNNVYNDATPVPFDDSGTAPYTGGDGVMINNVIYP